MAVPLRNKLLDLGWNCSYETLDLVCSDLRAQGISDARALIRLDLADVPASAAWPSEVRELLKGLAKVSHRNGRAECVFECLCLS